MCTPGSFPDAVASGNAEVEPGDAENTPASCSQFCIMHMGGKFVLASKGHVYHLDNQDLLRGFVGEKAKVRGFLDPKTKIIRVVNIEAE
jgi:hypothetical protein